jgi:hypothetical protein
MYIITAEWIRTELTDGSFLRRKREEFEKLTEEINVLGEEMEIRKKTMEFSRYIGNDLEALKSDANGGRR